MSSPSDEIRKFINIVEGSVDYSEPLNEGILDDIKGSLSKARGKRDRRKLVKYLSQEWQGWLGRTQGEGTIRDMIGFMKKEVGLSNNDINEILNPHQEDSGMGPSAEFYDHVMPKDDVKYFLENIATYLMANYLSKSGGSADASNDRYRGNSSRSKSGQKAQAVNISKRTYDATEMGDILEHLGVHKEAANKALNKARIASYSGLSSADKDILSKIGYALANSKE